MDLSKWDMISSEMQLLPSAAGSRIWPGTAALLGAAHPDVAYPFSKAEVIAFVKGGLVDPLVEANELGCQIP